jgi:hypothetical protein
VHNSKNMLKSVLCISPAVLLVFSLIISGMLSTQIMQITSAQLNTASVASTTTTNMNNTNFLSYENPVHGIAIKYPSNWVKKESQNGSSNDIVTFISPSGSELVNIRGGQPAENISLEEWSGVAIDLLRKAFTNFTLDVSNSTTLSGLPAREVGFSVTIPSSGHEVKVLEVLTIKDGSRFWIAAAANPNDFSNFQTTLQTMINSFSFSPAKAVQQPSASGNVNTSRVNSSSHP